MTFLLGAALLAGAVVYFVLQPILTGRQALMERDDDEQTEAEARRRVTLLALRDVEYDRATGKLDDADYQSLRKELSGEALTALRAEEAERRAAAPGGLIRNGAGPHGDAGPLDLDAEIKRVREGLRAGTTCGGCGHVNPAGSRFCSWCGGVLASTPGQG